MADMKRRLSPALPGRNSCRPQHHHEDTPWLLRSCLNPGSPSQPSCPRMSLLDLPPGTLHHVLLHLPQACDVRAARQACKRLAAAARCDRLQADWLLRRHGRGDGAALDQAAKTGSARLIRLLLAAGCDAAAWAAPGAEATPEHCAALLRDGWESAPLHAVGAAVLAAHERLALHTAAYHGNAPALAALLEALPPDAACELVDAVPRPTDWVQRLPEDVRAHVRWQTYEPYQQPTYALPSDLTRPLEMAALSTHPETAIGVLLSHGAHASGVSLARLAKALPDEGEQVHVLQTLIAAGADPNLELLHAQPLLLAIYQKKPRLALTLLAGGAAPDQEGPHKGLFMFGAATHGLEAVVEGLLQRGACESPVGDWGMRFVVDATNTLARSTLAGVTPLIVACHSGYASVVGALAAGAADVEFTSDAGVFPLLHACYQGNLAVLMALIQAGANVNRVGQVGEGTRRKWWSPLVLAATYGHLEVVQALLRAGARVDLTLPCGACALSCARRCGHVAVVKALIVAGPAKGSWLRWLCVVVAAHVNYLRMRRWRNPGSLRPQLDPALFVEMQA